MSRSEKKTLGGGMTASSGVTLLGMLAKGSLSDPPGFAGRVQKPRTFAGRSVWLFVRARRLVVF